MIMGNSIENPRIIDNRVIPERTHPPLHSIRLLPGSPFYERQKDMLEFLEKQDTDSLLYNFRKRTIKINIPISLIQIYKYFNKFN